MRFTFLSAMNRLTCCPPGSLKRPNGLRHVVVASMMRSGTHILIDLILNNFPDYKSQPLYVNLDMFMHLGGNLSELEKSGGFVVKTHFPQSVECNGHEEALTPFLMSNKVILVTREPQDIKKSLGKFGEWGASEVANFDNIHQRFHEYWENNHQGALMRVKYSDLIDSKKTPELLDQIEAFTGLTRSLHLVGVIAKNRRNAIFISKATTRLLGHYAPRINTGIKLGN